MSQSKQDSNSTRRQFASAISLRGGAIAAALKLGPVHASGDDTLKIGLIGCGGRGTGAATQALKADGRCLCGSDSNESPKSQGNRRA